MIYKKEMLQNNVKNNSRTLGDIRVQYICLRAYSVQLHKNHSVSFKVISLRKRNTDTPSL